MKIPIKWALTSLDKLGLLDVVIRSLRKKLIIVMYHNIGECTSKKYFEEPLSPRLLEEHIRYFIRNRFIVTSLREALVLAIRKDVSKPIVVLTFDDGYKGVYRYAYPLFKKYNIRATLYLTAKFVENGILPWWEQLYYIFREAFNEKRDEEIIDIINNILPFLPNAHKVKKIDLNSVKNIIAGIIRSNDYHFIVSIIERVAKYLGIKIPNNIYDEYMLSIDEIKEMSEYGIEIGGHGAWHVNLTKLSTNRLLEEIRASLNFVKRFNDYPYSFAYPFGLYNNHVVEALRSSKFSAAVTVYPKLNPITLDRPFELGRLLPYRYGLKHLSSLKYSIVVSALKF